MLTQADSPTARDLLWRLDGSLAGLTGRDFFQTLTQLLASCLDARCAFVCEFVDDNSRATPLVFWLDGAFVDVATYELSGTPCERVLSGDIALFERAVAEQFPHHREELEAIGAESYLAIPMKDRAGGIIGHVAVIDTKRRNWHDTDLDALRICSSHATAELEHERAGRALAAVNQVLEARVAERTRELEQARDELERRVEERTATLSAVNTRLRHEVAARAEAESALRRQEEAYRDLYEHAPNVYWSTGADGLIKRINQRAAELFGVPAESLIGRPFTDLVADSPDGMPRARKVFERFLAGEPSLGEEFEFRGAGGRTLWGSVNVLPILDADGRPVATRTTLIDITERRRAELALQHRLDLEQLLTQVATDFGSARHDSIDRAFERALARLGVWGRWDCARVYLYASGRTEAELRYEWSAEGAPPASAEPLISRRFMRRRDEFVDIPCAEDVEDAALGGRLAMAGAGGVIAIPVAKSSACLGLLELATYGRRHEWLREDVPVLKLLGELMASTLERCAAERALESARRDAEAASLAKSDFLARMSHELRTPLNAILGYAQLLERDATVASQHRQQIATIYRAGEHLLTLINEVLDLARVESGRVEIEAVETDVGSLVRGVGALLKPRAESAGLEFRCVLAADCAIRVLVDDRRLRQILINLLGNAIKFTPTGGSVTLNVDSEGSADGRRRLRFEVADTGVGIAADELGRIFEPFFQAGRRPTEGIGLGLAITRRFVEAMDGSLEVESQIGCGTRFTLTIPVHEAGLEQQDRTRVPAVVGFRGRPRRILIADDVTANRELLGEVLRPLGFEVAEAADGLAALAAIEASAPDLVLFDIVMPGIDGFELAKRLRERGVPVPKLIAVSANAFDATRERCLAAGCEAFIAKPVDLDELLGAIARTLDLEWLHAGADRSAPTVSPTEIDAVPATERLRSMLDCVRTGDVVVLRAAAAELADEHVALGAALLALCDRFDLRGIERLLESVLERAPGTGMSAPTEKVER